MVLLLVVVWYLKDARVKQSEPNNLASTQADQQKTVEITDVPKERLPERFPSGIPFEDGAEITYNYNAVNLNNKFQSTREFVSAKSEQENYEFYQSELKAKGWEITAATQDSANKQSVIFAKKGDDELNIRIYSDASGVKVAISNETQP